MNLRPPTYNDGAQPIELPQQNEDDATVTRARFRHLRIRHWLTGQPRPVKSIAPLGQSESQGCAIAQLHHHLSVLGLIPDFKI